MSRSAWIRILPFAVFMAFIGVQQAAQWALENGLAGLSAAHLLFLYPVKIIIVAILLACFYRGYDELRFRDLNNIAQTGGSILLGLLVFVLWINMDWPFASIGESQGFDPTPIGADLTRNLLIMFRIAGAAILVPVMEELFWRSFLLRYIVSNDFDKVRLGTFTWSSFLIGAVLFGLEHHLVLAGIMAGMAYSLLLYRTRSIMQCILAHGVTNLALGCYVLAYGAWQFW